MISIVVHGGAWDIPRDLIAGHTAGVHNAVKAGWGILKSGGSAADAVQAAIVSMEDDETFDAGRGSVLNLAGEVEMDASMMEGRKLKAGAIAAVQNIRNPIRAARAIMDKSEEVLLVGMGATRFAREQKIPTCSQDDLITARELERWRANHGKPLPTASTFIGMKKAPMGTVGAVALDKSGTVVAGTSTGGTPNKNPGRVGDTPLIGCGTYADNHIGGVSCTGWGEALIRVVMAKSVIDFMEEHKLDPDKAAREGIALLKQRVKGYGGIIALNARGEFGIAFNTARMARGWMNSRMKSPMVLV